MIDFKDKRILVLAPHADDEISCGGTIARAVSEGAHVTVAVLADCSNLSDVYVEESAQAAMALGCSVRFERVAMGRELTEHRQVLLDVLIELRDELAPDIVICPSSTDTHQDHEAVHREAVRAFRSVELMLGYEAPRNQRVARLDVFVMLLRAHLETKITASRCYVSQRGRGGMHDGWYAIAHVRGFQSRSRTAHEFAEAFEFIRGRL